MTPVVLLSTPSQDYWKIGVEYAQTIGFAYVAKELAKLCVSRPRPYMYFDNAPQNKIHEGDWDDSFFSGHATLSFAAAGCTTYMFWYNFTDWLGLIPVFIALAFAVFGLIQLIKLRSILKVNKQVLLLGGFYLVIIGSRIF